MGLLERWRRGAPAADQYESAAGRLDQARRAQNSGDAVTPPPGVDLGPPGRPRARVVLAIFVVALLFALLQARRGSTPPPLTASCTKAQLALSTDSSRPDRRVSWSATGPRDAPVIVAVDVDRFTKAADGRYSVVPLAGHRSPLAGGHPTSLTGCTATGYFAARLPAGAHTVTLFRLTDSGSERLASRPLEVSGG